ncbi:uncharacterized protein LOC130709867 [Lotus japonicus]|uniref:uncharacterized protein LOC130709867 n=1 Tax=Lotus japonicus TaxID=34305 RepID=UPI00258E35E3|nr:uncharacterized protein LOC130709867 [Lotus japonicus]
MSRFKNSEALVVVARFALHQPNLHIPMANLMGFDPCFRLNRAFSQYPALPAADRGTYISSPFLRNLACANVFGGKRSVGLGPKGCSFVTSGGIGSKFAVRANAGPRGFATRRDEPMLAGLEQGNSVRDGDGDAAVVKVDDGSLSGSPTEPASFGDQRLLSQKLVVAVDVDEVLGNFVSALNKFIADRYSSNHSLSEYHVYEFFKIWNCSRDEADIRVHEFFKTPYFKSGIHPLPGAKTALQKLSRFCSLSVVTSRQNVIKDHTIEWIEKNYPGLFHEIHFGNHFALDGLSRPKSEICRSLNAKVLIDDNPRYATECAEAGIEVLLFDYENSYPWSKNEAVDKHPLVTKVKNWEEVEQQLMSVMARIC